MIKDLADWQPVAVSLLLFFLVGGALFLDIASALLYVLAFLAIIWILRRPHEFRQAWGSKLILLMSVASLLYVIPPLLSWVLNGLNYADYKVLDKPVRLLLLPVVIAFLASVTVRPRLLVFSVVVCALAAATLGVVECGLTGSAACRAQGATDPVTFGNTAVVAAILCLAAASYCVRKKSYWYAAGLVAGALAAVLGVILSQTRISVIALLVLLFLYFFMFVSRTTSIVVPLVVAIAIGIFSDRIGKTMDDALEGSVDVSISMRIVIWQEALALLGKSPIYGVGRSGYERHIQELAATGEIPSYASECCMRHAHNDLLHALATKGVLGGAAYLVLIIVPFTLLIRKARAGNTEISHLAFAGASMPLLYFIFGMTGTMFERSLSVVIYIAILSAIVSMVVALEAGRSNCTAKLR